jgi:hypothetical protein
MCRLAGLFVPNKPLINASIQKKLDVWGPQLKENGPQAFTDIVMPTVSDVPSLSVDGAAVEIVNANGLANWRYLWVPSLEAIFGGVMVFSGVHVWTADTATSALRAAWVKIWMQWQPVNRAS